MTWRCLDIKKVALLGDSSNHGGVLITTNQDNRYRVGGVAVTVQGALHSCPIQGHGVTSVTAVTNRSFCNGKLILTQGAVAGCGAVLTPPNRNVYVE